jgi:hypothetical protein
MFTCLLVVFDVYVIHFTIYTYLPSLLPAHKTVKDLEEKLFSLEALDIKESHSGREIRIWYGKKIRWFTGQLL